MKIVRTFTCVEYISAPFAARYHENSADPFAPRIGTLYMCRRGPTNNVGMYSPNVMKLEDLLSDGELPKTLTITVESNEEK